MSERNLLFLYGTADYSTHYKLSDKQICSLMNITETYKEVMCKFLEDKEAAQKKLDLDNVTAVRKGFFTKGRK